MTKKQIFHHSFDMPPPAETPSLHDFFNESLRLYQKGNLDQARQLLERILADGGEYPDALNLLGVIETRSGRHETAENLLTSAITVNPNIPEYHNNLGKVLESRSKYREAWNAYQQALSMKPDYAEAMFNQARLAEKMGNTKEAERLYIRLTSLYPVMTDAWQKLAQLYQTTRQPDKAEEVFMQALAVKPSDPVLLNKFGIYLQNQGRLAEAETAYNKAIQADANHVHALYNLANIRKQKTMDETLAGRINTSLSRQNISNREASELHFALGKIFNDAGNYAEAFEHYQAGNAIRRKMYTYNAGAQRAFVEKIMEEFDRKFIESRQLPDVVSEAPVFIVGMPRSGSTLVEQILASHPGITGVGELPYFLLKNLLMPKQYSTINSYPACVGELNMELLLSVAWEYTGMLKKAAGNPAALRIIDKQLYNFLHIGLIRILFPRARIINCQRDPMDNCLAIYFANFTSDDHQYAYDLESIGYAYRDYQRLMEHWNGVLASPVCNIDYAALVTDQEQECRRVLDYIGLEWDARCLEFYKTERIVNTASFWQVRQPLYTHALNRWKHYEAWLDPLKRILAG